jgi:uncharacterized protein YjbI with pentapeptide repeats
VKFNITNRWTGSVLFEAEIEADENTAFSIKLGMAVKKALVAKTNLTSADLAGANLAGANLDGADLAGANLAGANLTGAYLARANLDGADLTSADLAGAYLDGADLAGANLAGANLTGAYLARANLDGADLTSADLAGADLAGANLAGANLAGANLDGAYLTRANLAGAKFTGADLAGANEIPVVDRLDSKILAAIDAGGTLEMEIWHTCETAHCRAGWAITLAGETGKRLEDAYGSAAAGALIYARAYPNLRVPNFYTTNAAALADIRARASTDTAPVAKAGA